MNLGASLGVKMVPKAYRDSYLRRVSGNGMLNLPIGLLRATVFRHFLEQGRFTGLHGASRGRDRKLAVLKEMVAISPVKQSVRKNLGFWAPLSVRNSK